MNALKRIETRADIYKLVCSFYDTIQKDDLLGPIFNSHISESEWPAHFDKLTDFWVTNLFGEICFKGNPSQTHVNVDKNLNHTISPQHFERWVSIWFSTIDRLYEGDLANRAKDASQRMAMGQFGVIYRNRNAQ